MNGFQRGASATWVACSLLTAAAHSQWGANPALNLAIGDKPGDQVQPKIRTSPFGSSYVSWFDNNAGGYDVYLQYLGPYGDEAWPHNGVLIADRSFSSTQDYGLSTDQNDHAYLAFRDDRSGSVHVTAQKVNWNGTMLWGAGGVQVTTNPGVGSSPRIAALSDGGCVVGWSESGGFRLQRLNANGAPQWPAGGIINAPVTGSFSLSDLLTSEDGSVIALWVRFIGNINSNKHLYAQKFDANGAATWNDGNPVIVFDATSVQIGYFPNLRTDGAGGAVFGWYEVGAPRNCYVQRVNAKGVKAFAHNGVAVSTNTANIRLSPDFAYNPATGETFIFWTEANSVQSQWGLYGQKISASGTREWSDTGKEIIPLSGNQTSFVKTTAFDDGAMVFCFDRSGPSYLVGARLNGAGQFVWPGSGVVQVCSTLSGKSRLDIAANSCGDPLLVWSDARTDGGDIFAQNVHRDATFGNKRPGDTNGDGMVNINDLLAVINAWGACPAPCPADVAPSNPCWSGEGIVNVNDLIQVINGWGS